MLYVLAIADRGLVSHAQVFRSKKAAEEGLAGYLKENERYQGPSEIAAMWQWLEEHDERLSVEITVQADDAAATEALVALRHIYDVLYLDLDKDGEFYKDKTWDADTTAAIADIIRQFFPKPPSQTEESDEQDLTPADRVKFVERIEQVSPYEEGLDADGDMVSPSDFITDLLTDIRHYCDAKKVEFAVCDRSAYRHYANERRDGNLPASRQTSGHEEGGDVGCS